MTYTQEEWGAATVFTYGRNGMMTYALDATGRVLVDQHRGCQVLDYSDKVPPALGPAGSSMGTNWRERVKAAKACLRDDGWPLDR